MKGYGFKPLALVRVATDWERPTDILPSYNGNACSTDEQFNLSSNFEALPLMEVTF